ncbi:MAG: restriction endonuclease subunit S [Gammaproteobacteria bacterium]|nr:restriction endonuclease subunit S [Gammaproteobacteria bacterium]HBF07077.1 restriction endonuclease subunit S [Gammaproteobacteria bacterium]
MNLICKGWLNLKPFCWGSRIMALAKNVPAVRFEGFSGAWCEHFLGAIADVKTGPFGSALHAKDYINDGYPIITTEHFKNGVLPQNKAAIPQVGTTDYLRLRSYVLEKGDIVFSRVGSVDINAHVTDYQIGWLFSGRVLRVRTDLSIDSEYLHYELDTARAKKSVLVRAVGQTMPSINTEILKNTPVFLPMEKKEQTRIGSYFHSLDTLIAKHQQKHDKLLKMKKALLEKMFPKQGASVPEVRFKGFSGEWEVTTLGEIASIRRGLTYKPSDIVSEGVKVLRSSNIDVNIFVSKDDDVHVNENAVNIKLIDEGEILITSANGSSHLVGKHAIVENLNQKSVHGGFMLVASTSTPYFLNASMNTDWYKNFLALYVAGGNGAIGNIKASDLSKQDILIPKNFERNKIGTFFQTLDTLITQHQTQIKKLSNLKQACLAAMFV